MIIFQKTSLKVILKGSPSCCSILHTIWIIPLHFMYFGGTFKGQKLQYKLWLLYECFQFPKKNNWEKISCLHNIIISVS